MVVTLILKVDKASHFVLPKRVVTVPVVRRVLFVRLWL
jgi:hypothetical protein